MMFTHLFIHLSIYLYINKENSTEDDNVNFVPGKFKSGKNCTSIRSMCHPEQ